MARHSHPYHVSYTVCVSSRVSFLPCVCFLCTCHKSSSPSPTEERASSPRSSEACGDERVWKKALASLQSVWCRKALVVLALPEQWGLRIQRWKSHRWQGPGFSSLSFQWCHWAVFAVPSLRTAVPAPCPLLWLSQGCLVAFTRCAEHLESALGQRTSASRKSSRKSNHCFGSCLFPRSSPSFKRPSLKLPTQLQDFMASAFPLLLVMAVIIGRLPQLSECPPVFCSHAFTFQNQLCLQNVPCYNYNYLSQ